MAWQAIRLRLADYHKIIVFHHRTTRQIPVCLTVYLLELYYSIILLKSKGKIKIGLFIQMAVFLLHFIDLLCFLRFLPFRRISANFLGMTRLVDILTGIENYACDITFLAKISQLFMRSADKLRVHIVP